MIFFWTYHPLYLFSSRSKMIATLAVVAIIAIGVMVMVRTRRQTETRKCLIARIAQIDLERRTERKGTKMKRGDVKVDVIFNPTSGNNLSALVAKALTIRLREIPGVEATCILTEYAGHAKAIVASMKPHTEDHILCVVGGDGTVNEVANAMYVRSAPHPLIEQSLRSNHAAEYLRARCCAHPSFL